MPVAAPIASPSVVLCALPGFASSRGAGGRRAKSPARAGYELVSSTLLAAILLFAASTVSAHAQVTNWTAGNQSSDWFNFLNLSFGVPSNFPAPGTSVNIDTVTPNSTEIARAGATAFNVNVGQVGTGMLTIRNGGTLTDHATDIGFVPGSQGTAVVSGAGSSWANSGNFVIGFLGTGTLTIENGGVVNSVGGTVGLAGTGTATVTGPGSAWNTGGLTIGSIGTGSLTIADGATVTSPTQVAIAMNAGATGTLNIGAGAGNPAAAPGTLSAPSVAFGGVGTGTGTINFNHTSTDYVFAPAISGGGTVNVLAS
jgi:T5SS/PEP-CTERM-associated repeat protein